MKVLILDRLDPAWADLTIPNPFNGAIDLAAFSRVKLRGFPMPGRMAPDPVDSLEATAKGLRFPGWGSYFVVGAFGAAKVLLIDPVCDADARIVQISSFVAQCSWHSATDTHLCFAVSEGGGERVRGPFLLERIMEKLFFSDQPLGLHCGHVVDCLSWLLIREGYACRKVVLKNNKNIGHIFLDVFLPCAARWAYVDPDFGVMLRREADFLSSSEVLALRNSGRDGEIGVVDIGRKCFPLPAYNFPVSFSGQFTWTPEAMKNVSFALSDYYRQTVIERGFEGLEFHAYQVSEGPPISLSTQRLDRFDPLAPPVA